MKFRRSLSCARQPSRRATLLAATLAMIAIAGGASAQTVRDFYMGRTITLLVPDSPGGIDDLSARLVSRHLGKFIAGHPAIEIKYVPDGGGIGLANTFASTAPRDGSVIAVLQRSVPQLAIQGSPDVKFDPLAFTWLGSLSSFDDDAYMVLVNADFPAKTADDLKRLPTPARVRRRRNQFHQLHHRRRRQGGAWVPTGHLDELQRRGEDFPSHA